MPWTFVLGGAPPSGVEERELTAARGRTITWRLDGACTAQFTIDGRHDEAAQVVALATDLHIYDPQGVKRFRGRIGPETDDIGPNTHTSQFTAIDYRGMLAHRHTGATGATYTATAAGAIAWDLIADSQALSGGNWGITDGVGAAGGTARDKTIDPGKPLAESINELARLDNGMEWEIDADLAINRWYPTRGAANGVVLDFGGLVSRVRRQLDPSDFANSALATGAQGLTPVAAVTAGIGADPRGRWETAAGFPTISVQSTLDDKAPWMLDQASTLRAVYSVTMAPGRWEGATHIWLGDTVTLAINSGRLAVNDPFRVIEVSVQPGGDGGEVVTLGLLAV